MPQTHFNTGLPGLEIISVCELQQDVEIKARIVTPPQCPQCQSAQCRIKASFWRRLKHTRQGNRVVFLQVYSHKYLCLQCNRYFNAKIQGVYPKKQATETISNGSV